MNLSSIIVCSLVYLSPLVLLFTGGVLGYMNNSWLGLIVGLLVGLLIGFLFSYVVLTLARKIDFLNQRMTFDSFNSFRD